MDCLFRREGKARVRGLLVEDVRFWYFTSTLAFMLVRDEICRTRKVQVG